MTRNSRRPAKQLPSMAQALRHVDALYSDALCLTADPERAADLVVAAYVRAFRHRGRFQRRRAPGVLAGLYRHLHAAFCDEALDLSKHYQTPVRGRS